MNSNRAPTVFLSYASADREAARVLKDALPGLGLEVWYDEAIWAAARSGIRRSASKSANAITSCLSSRLKPKPGMKAIFAENGASPSREPSTWPMITHFCCPSFSTTPVKPARGSPKSFYRSNGCVSPAGNRMPPSSLYAAGWSRASRCRSSAALRPLVHRRKPRVPRHPTPMRRRRPSNIQFFPTEDPNAKGKGRYWFHVAGWALRSAWIFFNQLPRWVRGFVYVWLCIGLISKGCSSDDHRSSRMSQKDSEELHAISDKYRQLRQERHLQACGADCAITSDDAAETPAAHSPLLAIPFTAPAGNAEAAKVADSAFALVYGKIAIAHRGRVGLSPESAACDESAPAVERGRSNHSTYVLCGAIGADAAAPALSVKLLKVGDAALLWSKSYPVAGADPNKIAEEVNAHVPSLDDE